MRHFGRDPISVFSTKPLEHGGVVPIAEHIPRWMIFTAIDECIPFSNGTDVPIMTALQILLD